MSSMKDCRTCKHNTYAGSATIADWVDCSHPVTIAKTPKLDKGDPEWVNFMTSDRKAEEMIDLMGVRDCPAWVAFVSPAPDDDADYYRPDSSGYSRADEEWFFDMDGKP